MCASFTAPAEKASSLVVRRRRGGPIGGVVFMVGSGWLRERSCIKCTGYLILQQNNGTRRDRPEKVAIATGLNRFPAVLRDKMVRPEGVEPSVSWFVAKCSVRLSYGRA